MRFAWLRKNSPDHAAVKLEGRNRLIRMVYNAVWWVPIVLTLLQVIDYDTGFILFAIITIVRLGANLYLNNVLQPERFESFPFRA